MVFKNSFKMPSLRLAQFSERDFSNIPIILVLILNSLSCHEDCSDLENLQAHACYFAKKNSLACSQPITNPFPSCLKVGFT